MKNFKKMLGSIFTVPNTFDPDDQRRRQVLNSVLLFLSFVGIFNIIITLWYEEDLVSVIQKKPLDFLIFVIPIASAIILFVFLLVLNRSRRVPKNLVGWICVVGLVGILSVSDYPVELTAGRSIFVWAIPVTLSVIVLPPASVLIVDFLITAVFAYYSGFDWSGFQLYTLSEIYIVSFISWLGMSLANKAIQDARNEANKNTAILEGVGEGVMVLGQHNQIVLANLAASELMGDEMFRIVPMLESAEIQGRTLAFHWSEVEGVGRVAIVRDISRQIEIDHARDAILRVVSHEMRTPLAAIMGHTEMLAATTMSGSDRLERIRANAQRMLTLVGDLLDQACIEAGALKMQNESFSSITLANSIRDAFSARSESKQIELNVVVAESLPEVLTGDLHRYQQILTNLVDNAIKFTECGGRVNVLLASCDSTDQWQMVVRDTGIGIPLERLPDIFLPFRRASDYAKRSYQGVGLGLSIAKRIAQLAHGDIQVKSTVGHGSTFIVTLPINGGV
jgi:signal transduction histidine kinase